MSSRCRISLIAPVHATPVERTLEIAEAAERAGLDGVWIPDHLINKTRPSAGVAECWTTLAAVAARTRTVGIGPLVLTTPFRHAALIAKGAATVEAIAPGRLTLGIGAGGFWYEDTCRALGFELLTPGQRVAQCEETVEAIRALWSDTPASFDGGFVKLRNAELYPKPARTVPIAIAARKPRMLAMAARQADIWNCPLPHELRSGLRSLEAAGRPASTIGVSVFAVLVGGATEAEARRNLEVAGPSAQMFGDVESHHLFGTPERIAARMRELFRDGAEEITLDARGMGVLEAIDMLQRDVRPLLD